jgi:hypothetical protein
MDKLALVILISMAILVSSCSPIVPGSAAAGPAAPRAGDSALATVKINVPSVAPFVVMDKGGGAAKALGSKLFMGATKVHFAIYDGWYSNLRGSWDIEKSIGSDRWNPASTEISIFMPTGYFTYLVDIYNSNVDPSNPTAHYQFNDYNGWSNSSAGFRVALEGPNTLSVTVTPTTITRISASASTLLYEATENFSLNRYGEAWFIFTARTETLNVKCTTSAGDADIYIFEPSDYSLVGSSTLADLALDSVSLTQAVNTYHDFIIGVWGFQPGTTYSLLIEEPQASGSVTIN